jgi:hypothetical protein
MKASAKKLLEEVRKAALKDAKKRLDVSQLLHNGGRKVGKQGDK